MGECKEIIVRRILALLALSIALLLPSATLHAADPIDIRIDARDAAIADMASLNKMEMGFTDVVPPQSIRQYYRATPSPKGYIWELYGTELSVWQTTDIPPQGRYLLNWRFVYEGRIAEGRGRTGFILGNPGAFNLLSVEVTYGGTLRLVDWGRSGFERLGRIVYSRQVTAGGPGPIRIEADYDMKEGTLICRVNDAPPADIRLSAYMPSAPLTIRGVGFFTAVPEAPRRSSLRMRDWAFDIDLSKRHTKAEHALLEVHAK